MKSTLLASLAVALLFGTATQSARAAQLRIDGTSDESFDRSYTNLVQELSPTERRRFALALFAVLLPEKCLSSEAIVALTFLPASADQKAKLRSCRTQLNGKSFKEIVDAADEKSREPSTPVPPNNALEQSAAMQLRRG